MRCWLSRNREWIEVFLIYLLSKIYQIIFVYWGHGLRKTVPPGGWEGVNNWLLNPWTTYDSQGYIEIATKGYKEVTAAFFPLYPLLLKICGNTEVSRALAGVIISNLAFVFALYVLYLLTKLDFSAETGKLVVWITAFFPTAAFFGAVYTESLFLLFIALAFYAARQNNWAAAGITGGFAGLTRNPGPLLFASLLLEYMYSLKYNFKKIRINILWIFLVIVGFSIFHFYLYWRFGNPFLSITSQSHFYRTPAWPWEPVFSDVVDLITEKGELQTLLKLLTVLLVFYFSIRFYKLFRSYLLLMIGVIAMHLFNPRMTHPHTIGAVRYASVLFPFSQILAIVYSNYRGRLKVTKYLLITLYLMLNAIYSFWFGLKVFLG